jgi:hypothetical protein
MLTDELLNYLFDGQSHLLSEPMGSWLASSRRFTTFVTTFRDKIRKKLRVTKDAETLYDLRLELETAYRLLQERALNVVYEPQLGGIRSPDFAVTFTTSLTFMVEVTRLRTIQKRTSTETDITPSGGATLPDAIAETICSKLGQLLPQRSNVLVVGVDSLSLTQSDLQAAMLRIQQRAERNDAILLLQHGFRDRADFFRHYQRLSEVLVRGSGLQTDAFVVTWVNSQGKYPLPSKVRTALYRSHMSKA